MRSRIIGMGSYVPPLVVTNQDLTRMMDTTDEWIVQRTGIKERHWVDPKVGMASSELGLYAAEKAIQSAGIKKEEIDLIIFATTTPDHQFPGNGCFLQTRLGLNLIPTLDIRQACTGFIYSISIADQFIRTGQYRTILVVGGESQSPGLDKTTQGRDIGVIFGDGAGAAVIRGFEVNSPEKDSYIYSTHLHTDGSGACELWAPGPGTGLGKPVWLNEQMIQEGLCVVKMNGKKVFMAAVKRMSETVMECLQANGKTLDDVDLFFFHQANLRINEAVADQLRLPREKVFNTIHKYGNTTAATIPLGMSDAIDEKILKPGMLVVLAAFGSGYSWGSSLLRY